MIKTQNLTKDYGDLTAVANLNLTIQQGDIFGFIGPNGAGKTTTMRILVTLLEPTFGAGREEAREEGPQISRLYAGLYGCLR